MASFPQSAQEIFETFHSQGLIAALEGNEVARASRISPVESASSEDLVFVDKKDFVAIALERKPAIVVTSPKLKDSFAGTTATLLLAPNVPLAHALLKQHYQARDYSKSGWSGVHPSAIVHETARLHPSVIVEPRAVIGAGTQIGEDTRIMAGAVIENDVMMGARCTIHPNVVIGYGSRIGNEVVVGSGSVIGSEGYGFAQDQNRKSYPIPQTGIVVLEDRVRVGANCCIDRATYSETKIASGTKLDNLCHIAHNVQIGEDCLLTSMFCVAGSTKIGDRVIASGQTGIIDHMNVCSDAVLLHRAGVTQDIEKPGAYAGLPTQPLGEYLKNTAAMKSANDMRKRLTKVEAQLGINQD